MAEQQLADIAFYTLALVFRSRFSHLLAWGELTDALLLLVEAFSTSTYQKMVLEIEDAHHGSGMECEFADSG